MKKTYLTGIKPTGRPHIGNYFGAIRPMIQKINEGQDQYNYFCFLADYHALTTVEEAKTLKQNSLMLASIWLACGLNPDKVVFYQQSDIPQTFELATILSNVTPKGLLNRAHAYKAKVEKNREDGNDDDNDVNMGLFCYPILMASDILLMNSNFIPVGLDQKQHVEIARDIAKYFNKRYGNTLVMPNADIDQNVATIPGLDGRKMSKSYNNTIEIFCPEAELRKKIFSIKTDSTLPDQPKDTNCTLFEYIKLFFNKQEQQQIAERFAKGISWAEAKELLFQRANQVLTPIREKYEYYMQNPDMVKSILKNGGEKAIKIAQETILRVRNAIGVF